ncbi:hypothetical protein C8Q79DRAFT_184160 [Trametes meyenii]|nr:hypothetical protein C8Q79DRAFT_184160 [Trametes meyenii]
MFVTSNLNGTSYHAGASIAPSEDLSLPAALGIPSINTTIGAVYIGVVIGTALFGLTVHQAYRYYRTYTDDHLYIKSLVTTIIVLETFHSVLWSVVGYHYLITEAFQFPGIIEGHWSVKMTVTETTVLIVACGCFYSRRVYLVGPNYRWLVVIAVTFMVVALGFGFAAGVEAFTSTQYITDFAHISWLVSIAYGLAAVTDVILTGALVFVLLRSRTFTRRSDSVIYTLIIYTINTGLLTSIMSVAAFIFALILPGNMIYAAFSVIGAKLCANSVLAVLNSRKAVRDRFVDDFTSIDIRTDLPSYSGQPHQNGGNMISMVRVSPAQVRRIALIKTDSWDYR